MKKYVAAILLLGLSWGPAPAQQSDWVVGRWALAFDPNGAQTDWLEFTAEGDAHNVWADGTRVPGLYIVTAEGVKAVFTHGGKDIIATFHVDSARTQLRIVTSATGVESVYRKVAPTL